MAYVVHILSPKKGENDDNVYDQIDEGRIGRIEHYH